MLGVLCAGGTLKQVISEVRGRRQAHVSVDRVSHKVGGTQTVSFRLFYNNLGAAAVTALQFPVTDLIFATLQVAYWAARGLSSRRGALISPSKSGHNVGATTSFRRGFSGYAVQM